MKRWVYRQHEPATVEQIRSDYSVSPLLARLLAQRQIDDIGGFLKPGLSALHDPYLMLGMQRAVERIRAAVANRERILVYGDYDVDGTTSVVVLKTAIELLGGLFEALGEHSDKLLLLAQTGLEIRSARCIGIRWEICLKRCRFHSPPSLV